MTSAQFNYAEASLWFLFAGLLLVRSITWRWATRRFKNRITATNSMPPSIALQTLQQKYPLCIYSIITFVVFGISDLIEAKTGAWWRPWPLLALKACCVVALILIYRRYRLITQPTQ